MSKKIILAIAVIALAFTGAALAQVPNVTVNSNPGQTINTTWTGVNGDFWLSGQMFNIPASPFLTAANVNIWNGGANYSGSANIVNTLETNPAWNGSPYNYGVNSTASSINAGFTGGGYAQFDLTRDSSHASYGPAGQYVYGDVSSDATGQLGAANITTNYAKMLVYNSQLAATGTFFIDHGITDGVNGAGLTSSGTGSSQVSAGMYSSAGGALGGTPLAFTFGRGGGCYPDASVIATGSGVFTESAGASNLLNIYTSSSIWATHHPGDPGNVTQPIPGNGTPGSAYYNLQIGYSGNFTLANFSVDGK